MKKSTLGNRKRRKRFRPAWLASAAIGGRGFESGPRLEAGGEMTGYPTGNVGFEGLRKVSATRDCSGCATKFPERVSQTTGLYSLRVPEAGLRALGASGAGSSLTQRWPSSPTSSQGHPSVCVSCSPLLVRTPVMLDQSPPCLRSRSVVSNCLQPHGLQPARPLCPWDAPGKNTGVGCHFLAQRIFSSQGLNPGFLHCSWILYWLSHQGSHFLEIRSF